MLHLLRQHLEKTISLNDEEFAWISQHFTIRKYKRREYLFQEGEQVKYAYYVLSGLLKLVYHDEYGKTHMVSFAMEDWWETDFQAFYQQGSATLALQCLENTEVCCLSLAGYESLCKGLPKMEHFFLKKAHAGHIASQHRILSFLTSNASERYDLLLKRYPGLVQRVPKTLLAAYLGVSRETLSRLSS